MLPFIFSLLLLLIVVSFSPSSSTEYVTVEGKVKLRYQLPNGTTVGALVSTTDRGNIYQQITVILNGDNNFKTYETVKQDGKFTFEHVGPGSYLLEPVSPHYKFEPLRIDVSSKQNGKVIAYYLYKNTKAAYPISLVPVSPKFYFEEEKQLNILAFLLQNKMMMIMLGMIGFMYLVQKLASPETMKEMYQQSNTNSEESKLLPNFRP